MKDKKNNLPFDGTPMERLLAVREVANVCGLSARSIWRLSENGNMPKPVTIAGSRRWKESELRQWIAMGCPKIAEVEAKDGE